MTAAQRILVCGAALWIMFAGLAAIGASSSCGDPPREPIVNCDAFVCGRDCRDCMRCCCEGLCSTDALRDGCGTEAN